LRPAPPLLYVNQDHAFQEEIQNLQTIQKRQKRFAQTCSDARREKTRA
jgi:hypothetical protein